MFMFAIQELIRTRISRIANEMNQEWLRSNVRELDDLFPQFAVISLEKKHELVIKHNAIDMDAKTFEYNPFAPEWFFVFHIIGSKRILKRKWSNYIMDGIEYFMANLSQRDSETLWQWYLENNGDGR